jgi:hypothetical protein
MSIMRTIILSLLLSALTASAQARQYVVMERGQQHVVHTRRAPVILHRLLPPYTGIHLHESELRWR